MGTKATDDRTDTLRVLLDLAEGSSPAECWDDERAERLLRSQSSREELIALGASPATIERIFNRSPKPAKNEAGAKQAAAAAPQVAGTFSVRVEARFESAHYLREYRGISEPLHGHSYKVEADLIGKSGGIDSDAIAVDFVTAKKKLEELARRLDYGCINDIAPFNEINPTAENIAAWFHRELSAAVAAEHALVRSITIWEGPVNAVTFTGATEP